MSTRSRQDIHAEITNKLIKAIEANPGEPVMPWRKSGKPLWLPANALTGNRYNGINIISLWVAAETAGYHRASVGDLPAVAAARRPGEEGREGLARRLLQAVRHRPRSGRSRG